MIRFSVFSVVFLAALPIYAQECEAPPEVKAAIEAAPGRSSDERVAAARKVRDQFPSDYFAHRFYQELFVTQGLFSKAIQEEYRALLDEHPDDLLYLMLYARTLKGTNTPEAIRLLDQILQRDPDYPPARLKLVEIYSAPAFRDDQKLAANAESYWKVCPASLSGYAYVNHIEDTEFNARTAARLQKLLEGRTDTEALGLYNTLWTLEFKAVPLAEQEPVRERIRKDAELLRSGDFSKQPFLLHELAQAYQLLGDAEGSKWAEAEMARRGTPGTSAAAEAINQWRRTNPYKTGFGREAYQEKLLKQTDEWIHQWPDDPQPRYERFQALRMMQDAPLEDTVSAAADWIRIYERRPVFIAPYLMVAQFYAQHNMRYPELPDLLEKALKKSPETQPAPVSDLYPASGQSARSRQLSAWSTLNSAASIFLKIKKYDRARELLAQFGPSLLKEKPPESAPESEKRQYESAEFTYWTSMATLARVDGNKLDLLNYERNRILTNSYSNPSSTQYQTNSLRELWKEVKGSDEGFEAWLGKPGSNVAPKSLAAAVAATSGNWAKLDKPLPDFKISDADGKNWRLADLKGKVTLVNLWATWCGPCREELPYLQKLFNKVRERKDLAVITFNTDENPGMIAPFLKENKYTFPVLPASGYVSKLVPELSIPRNWIVDANGVLRLERTGFGAGDDRWVDDVIAEMEKVSTGQPAPVPSSQEAQLEAALEKQPGNIEIRSNLMNLYFRNAQRDPAAEKARIRNVLWMVVHHPEAAVMAEPCATVSKPGDDYDGVEKAWLAQLEKADVMPQVLANAANFFRPLAPARSIGLLAKARTLDPKNWMWTAMLAQMYAFQLGGVSGLNQNGFPVEVDPATPRSHEAEDMRAKLLASRDAELLAAVAGSLLFGQAAIAAAMTGRVEENAVLAERLVGRARQIDPNDARWPVMMAQAYAQEAERSTGDKRAEYVRKSMAEFNAAAAIDPRAVGDAPPSKYSRMAVEAGELAKARASAERCLAQAAASQVKEWMFHECTLILGRVSLREGDLKRAGEYLLAAARVHGDGALSSFGPNMMLAQELLAQGQRDAVLEYFDLCGKFWTYDRGQLKRWTEEAKSGAIPSFGANLIY